MLTSTNIKINISRLFFSILILYIALFIYETYWITPIPDIHYPQYSKISFISRKQYHELCLKGIKAHLPVTAQESILENYISIYVNLEKQLALL